MVCGCFFHCHGLAYPFQSVFIILYGSYCVICNFVFCSFHLLYIFWLWYFIKWLYLPYLIISFHAFSPPSPSFSPLLYSLLSYKILCCPVGLELLGWSGLLASWVAELAAHTLCLAVVSFKNQVMILVKTCGLQELFRFFPFLHWCSVAWNGCIWILRKIFKQKFLLTVKFDPDFFFPFSHLSHRT